MTPAPSAAQVVATDAVSAQLIGQLVSMQRSLEGEIEYLANAAANLADRQMKLSAVKAQLSALGYVAPDPITADLVANPAV